MIDDIPVIDAVIHSYNLDPSNCVGDFAKSIVELVYFTVEAFAPPGYRPDFEDYAKDWTVEETASMVFAESATDIACHHVLPVFAFKDGLVSFEKTLEAQKRWPGRIITYCGVDPLTGSVAFDEMDRQLESLDAIGLKLYPNSFVGSKIRGWKMDDPEVAFPLFEHAQKRGLKTVAVHKAVPLGAVPGDYYRVDDIDRAAVAFPDLNFEIVHGGMAFVEETAWQIARFPNVYVNLEITASYLGQRPGSFAKALSTLLEVAGEGAVDKIFWGTGAMAFHPQPLIERFVRDFQFDEDLVENCGIPQLTKEIKRKILGGNYARMCGFDLDERMAGLADDEFSRATADGLLAPFSTTHAAGHVH